MIGLAPNEALAAYSAQVDAGTLTITGDRASDQLVLAASSTTLDSAYSSSTPCTTARTWRRSCWLVSASTSRRTAGSPFRAASPTTPFKRCRVCRAAIEPTFLACPLCTTKQRSRSISGGLPTSRKKTGGWTVDFQSYSPIAALEWHGYATVRALSALRRSATMR
jgi:hypothetical protein